MKHSQSQLADKPVDGNQALGNRIDGEKKTFKSHGTEQRRTVGSNEAWSRDFIAVQSQTCLRDGPNVSLSASDHDPLRAGRLQLKLFRKRAGHHGKGSASIDEKLNFFGTPRGTGQTSLYVKQSHFRYLSNKMPYCNSDHAQRNSREPGAREALNKRTGKTFTGLALCAMLFALSLSVEAQQPAKVPGIGFLTGGSHSANPPRNEAFRQGLRELGYVEGKNIVIEWRAAEGKRGRLPALATELVRLKVDVVVVTGLGDLRAAKEATATIPIVMVVDSDPVGSGFVASLARPGGNITGLATLSPEISGKQLELLKEMIPRLSRVAVFGTSTSAGQAQELKEIELTAGALEVKLQYLNVVGLKDIETAFRAASKGGAGAVLWLVSGNVANPHRKKIAELTGTSQLPVIYHRVSFVEPGGLMSYGASLTDLDRRAAVYVDKILKGAKPAELPVEQPTKFEFVINLKAAKQIGLTIPPNVLARAGQSHQVIVRRQT
jgi:putative ABC transport system substrate-binding protein